MAQAADQANRNNQIVASTLRKGSSKSPSPTASASWRAPGAFGLTNRPDELLHLVIDALERSA